MASLASLHRAIAAGRMTRREALSAGLAVGLSLAALATLGGRRAARANTVSARAVDSVPGRFDYIIIGAGSAGAALAARLSEKPDVSVLVIEAGPWAETDQLANPQAWPGLQGSDFDWRYTTTAQAGLNGRVLPYPRGKLVGGSGAINALGHQRGAARNFDDWANAGATGWGWQDVLPHFKAMESFSGGASETRGGEGPISVILPTRNIHPLARDFGADAISQGYQWHPDLNSDLFEGIMLNQYAIRLGEAGGVRADSRTAYLDPRKTALNPTVLTDAPVTGLLVEQDRCVGISYLHGGERRLIRATREVILAAGAIDSPRLLMVSGIGPAGELSRHGVPVLHDLPGVGENLQDHPLVPGIVAPVRAEANMPVSRWNHGEAMLFHREQTASEVPDILIMCVTVGFPAAGQGVPSDSAYSLVPCLIQPESRGRVRLAGADPLLPAAIDPGFLTSDSDAARLGAGVALARQLARGTGLAYWRSQDRDLSGDGDPVAYARANAASFYHPVGSCRMGAAGDAGAVVDPALKVRGLQGLRIADASIMPSIPAAMTNAASVMIAEKAASLILASS